MRVLRNQIGIPRGTWLVTTVLFLLALQHVHAQSIEGEELTPVARSLSMQSLDKTTVAKVPLDSQVYGNATQELSDLRILDDRGIEMPFLLRNVIATTKKSAPRFVEVREPSLRPVEDDGLVIEFEINPAKYTQPIRGFKLLTRAVNFEHLVSLDHRAAEGDPWRTLASDVLLYDYSQFMDVHNNEVAIEKETDFPVGGRFRMRISKVVQDQQSRWTAIKRTLQDGRETSREEIYELNRQPLRIDQIMFSQKFEVVASAQLQLREVAIRNVRITNDKVSRSTWIDFECERDLLSEVTLATSAGNFSRNCRLLSRSSAMSKDKEEWQSLVAMTLTKIDITGVEFVQLTMPCPPQRAKQYRFVIENGDNPPIEDLHLSARGPQQELLFLVSPERSYSLTYGVSDRPKPVYDTVAIEAALRANILPLAAVPNAPVKIDIPPRDVPKLKWYENTPLVFGTIFGLVVVLAAALYQAAIRLSHIQGSTENPTQSTKTTQ
jgi:hypothetical protein